MKKTAVIGPNGFLGKYIVAGLLKNGHEVVGVFNKNADSESACRQIAVNDFLNSNEQFDNITFAAGNYQNTHQELIALNCDLVRAITEKYKDARFLYISSVNVYGVHTDVIAENSPFNAPLLYGLSKLAGEFIATACKSFAVVRLTYLYGPKLNNKSFLPFIIEQANTKKNITLMGNGERSQDYLYVQDAADLCITALESDKNGIYLGATGKSYSNLHIAEAICSNVAGCTISFTGEEKGVSFYFDPKFTMTELNWQPKVDINDGIKQCLA